jgi:alpha-tubulin suppressor-like RCC1 family protein
MAKVKKIFKTNGTLVVPAGVKNIRARKVFVHSLLKFWGYDNMADFASGMGFVHFIDFDNNMYGWGSNVNFSVTGAIGDNSQVNQSIPQLVSGGRKWRRQAAGIANPAGITLDGDLYTWGPNQGGSIGNNTTTAAFSSPVLVAGGLKWREARIPWGITFSGDLYMWGFNNFGCLGAGFNTPTMVSTPTLTIGAKKWRKAMTTGALSFGQDINGDWWSWGNNADFFGSNITGQLGAGLTIAAVSSPVAISGGIKFREVIPGPGVWGISETNDLYVWGQGGPFFNDASEAVITASTPFITVNYKSYSTPTLVTDYGKIKKVAPLAGVGSVALGFGSTQARKMLAEDGTLWCWGWDGIFFQSSCGNGLPQGSSTPVIIMPGKKFKFISFNNATRHWVIEENGDMWAWGDNSLGALGIGIHDNSFVFRSTPTIVAGGRKWDWVVDHAGGLLARSTDGSLWTWGSTLFSNTAGFPANLSSPVPVRNSLFFKEGLETETTDIQVTPGSSYAVVVTTGFPRVGDTQLGTNPYADWVEVEYDI